jgi:alpha-1,2-mannosyltransferase
MLSRRQRRGSNLYAVLVVPALENARCQVEQGEDRMASNTRVGAERLDGLMPAMAWTTLAIISLWAIGTEFNRVFSEHGLWDFGAFVASGRAAATGQDPYGIYPPLTPHVVFPGFESWNPNLNPPISALLFQMFDLGEPAQALRIWSILSMICYASAVLLLLWRYRHHLHAPLVALWALGMAGFIDTLYLGQIYTPLVLAAVGAWLFLERGKAVPAGILIGLLISMKPNFLVWPVLLFLAGYRVSSLTSIATAAAVAAIPLVVFGPDIYLDWLSLVAGDGDRAIFLTNASLSGLVARAGLGWLGTPLGIVLLLSLAYWAYRRKPAVLEVSAFALLASLLASPLGWIHYTLFLLPIIFHHAKRWWIWPVAIALVVPVPFVLAQFGKPVWVQLTTGSVYGWALVWLLVSLAWAIRHDPAQEARL